MSRVRVANNKDVNFSKPQIRIIEEQYEDAYQMLLAEKGRTEIAESRCEILWELFQEARAEIKRLREKNIDLVTKLHNEQVKGKTK